MKTAFGRHNLFYHVSELAGAGGRGSGGARQAQVHEAHVRAERGALREGGRAARAAVGPLARVRAHVRLQNRTPLQNNIVLSI